MYKSITNKRVVDITVNKYNKTFKYLNLIIFVNIVNALKNFITFFFDGK